MYDTRLTLFTGLPLTVSADGTYTGETIDFKEGYVGDYFEGSPVGYGLGAYLLFTSVTGSAFTVTAKWQVSADGSTWVDDQQIFTGDLEALATTGAYKVSTRLVTAKRYARLVLVTASMSGESFIFNAFVADGTTPYGAATQPRV